MTDTALKAAIKTALRRVEAGDLGPDDYRDIALLLEGVLPTDAPSITTETAATITMEDAVAELVKRRGQS